MASTASALSSSRPEAGPLPPKRGEIGFQEEVHSPLERTPTPVNELPARHPAERDVPPAPPAPQAAPAAPAEPAPSTIASSSESIAKKRGFLCFLKPKKVPTYGGILLTTFAAFLLQFFLILGTIAAWAIATIFVMHGSLHYSSSNSDNSLSSSAIFIHVVFGIIVLGQLLFLERRIFRLRAERYAFIHPGEMLPSARRRRVDPSIAFSPWNRPPLPTYAAALAQSGVGTGDVEDHLIAAPPPPAYGNTRGSTLILAGFLRDSLRAQRPVSTHTVMSERRSVSERPISYRSEDGEWQIIQDADRARQLEETLARLERQRE